MLFFRFTYFLCLTYFFIFNVEARAVFLYSRKVPMPHYAGFGIIFLQAFQQSLERFFLLRSPGIFRPVAGIQAAFVADADAVDIVVLGVCALLIQGMPGMNTTPSRLM